MIFECQDGVRAVFGIASIIAIGEPGFELSQISRPNRLAAERAKRLRAGPSAIYQDESHGEPTNAKRNTVSGALIMRLLF